LSLIGLAEQKSITSLDERLDFAHTAVIARVAQPSVQFAREEPVAAGNAA